MRTSLVVALAFASACSVSRGDGQPVQQTIGSSGGQITITASQDPTLAGTQLVIPPGAVPDGTVITIAQGAPQASAGESAVSPSVRLTPDGLVLAKPATLFVPYPGQPANSVLLVEVTSLGKKSQQPELLVSSAAGLAQFQIGHFSDWQIVALGCESLPQPDIASAYDFAQHPYDFGGGGYDLASGGSYDLSSGGSYDFSSGVTDLASGSHDGGGASYDLGPVYTYDGGDVADLAPTPQGYTPPATCEQSFPVDLAIQPKG